MERIVPCAQGNPKRRTAAQNAAITTVAVTTRHALLLISVSHPLGTVTTDSFLNARLLMKSEVLAETFSEDSGDNPRG